MLANQPKWLWYAGGAMIGVGVLLWIRSRGTQSGPALVSTPSANTQSELGNVNDSLLGLQALIQRSGGNVNTPPSTVQAGYTPQYAGYINPIIVNPNSNLTAAQQIAAANPAGFTGAQLDAAAAANAVGPNPQLIPPDWMAQYYINAANDPAAYGIK